jgi:hypothetical protein
MQDDPGSVTHAEQRRLHWSQLKGNSLVFLIFAALLGPFPRKGGRSGWGEREPASLPTRDVRIILIAGPVRLDAAECSAGSLPPSPGVIKSGGIVSETALCFDLTQALT